MEDDTGLLDSLSDPDYKARTERLILFHIKTWDINCPQHIKRRYTVEEFSGMQE